MLSTVIGSFPVEVKPSETFKDKLLNLFGSYDPYKSTIESIVKLQLDAGVDIIADGEVRGDMVSIFTKHISGMKLEGNSTVINNKITKPTCEISTSDLKHAKKLLNNYYDGNVPEEKGIKGLVTGPSTIIFSSRIESFYKNKNSAIIDLAHALRYEMEAISKVGVKYIQIDEPFLSTGLVDMKTAKETIGIMTDGLDIPVGMHVCGTLEEVFKELTTFNLDILDFEFAGNNVNLKILEDNAHLIKKDKKIGFGCLDTSKNEVDSYETTKQLVEKAIEILGKDRIILSPDCGLRKTSFDVAYNKLKVMNKVKEEYNDN
ncbi:MAG: methionine synthase [archaeon]|nr:methionine synthase [archaeon]